MGRSSSVVCTLGTVLALSLGCSSSLVDVEIVAVDVIGDVVIMPGVEAVFEVTAHNRTHQRIVWGMGSSSCQLGLIVLVGRVQHSIDYRACTDDLVEQGLDAGARRSEMFGWDGHIVSNGGVSFLPHGRYRVFGVAGDRGASNSLEVTISTVATQPS